MPTKSQNQRYHAKQRALSRYGLDYSEEDREEIIRLIQEGKAKLYDRQSRRVTVFILEYKGIQIKIVYDSMRKEIASFLPLEDGSMTDSKGTLPIPVKTQERNCFGVAWFLTEEDADSYANYVRQQDRTYKGGFFHGLPCGREDRFDYEEDGKKYYAVTQ